MCGLMIGVFAVLVFRLLAFPHLWLSRLPRGLNLPCFHPEVSFPSADLCTHKHIKSLLLYNLIVELFIICSFYHSGSTVWYELMKLSQIWRLKSHLLTLTGVFGDASSLRLLWKTETHLWLMEVLGCSNRRTEAATRRPGRSRDLSLGEPNLRHNTLRAQTANKPPGKLPFFPLFPP